MKSIKPGRATSNLGGIAGICAAVFGIIWIILAPRSGHFKLFGIPFVILAVALAIYHFRNANSENRYSLYDITEDGEEPDPLNERIHPAAGTQPQSETPPAPRAYCPYCGAKTAPDHNFCHSCGKRLP